MSVRNGTAAEVAVRNAPTTDPCVQPRPMPGDGLAHYCQVHDWDDECDADPAGCVSLCGISLADHSWSPPGNPDCVVCTDLYPAWLRARGR